MPHTVILHLPGEPAVIGEVDELPKPGDQIITVNSPRQKDGKDLHYLEPNVIQVIWPLHRVTVIEVLPGEDEEQIIGFVRE
jgi:hypothetical protein